MIPDAHCWTSELEKREHCLRTGRVQIMGLEGCWDPGDCMGQRAGTRADCFQGMQEGGRVPSPAAAAAS